jgi:hypothetical protein
MIYSLETERPPTLKVHKALRSFIKGSLKAKVFSDALFPQWFLPVAKAGGTHRGLWTKFQTVFSGIQILKSPQKNLLWNMFENHNQIEELCANPNAKLLKLSGLPSSLTNAFAELTDHLFEMMKSGETCANQLKIDQPCIPWHYKRFRQRQIVCPFCGLIAYPSSGEGCADYDHYLDRKHYPLCAANGDNLVPMCERCNRSVKSQVNVIVASGKRRVAYYPYGDASGVVVSCSCSEPNKIAQRAKWAVLIKARKPQSEAATVQTWMAVFQIEKRYRAVLEDDSAHWVRREAAVFVQEAASPTPQAFSMHLKKRAKAILPEIAREEKSILKAPVFDYTARLPKATLHAIITVARGEYGGSMRSRGAHAFR